MRPIPISSCPARNSSPGRAAEQATQADIEEAQHKAAERDKGAMTVIHVPIAALTGQDREGDVARGKGELGAIHAAIQSKDCK